MKITEPGIYDIDEATYHADPCEPMSLSASGAKLLLSEPFEGCPALYKFRRDNPEPPRETFDFGHVAHCLLLGKGAEIAVIDAADWRTKDAKDQRDAARDAGKTPILIDTFEKAQAMVKAVREHPFAGAAFANGTPERSLFWKDEDTHVWRRCRPDFLPRKGTIAADFKTCLSAHPAAISRAFNDYGYFLQAAWYMDGIAAVGACEQPAFVFVFQEKTEPYLVTVVQPTPAAIEWGRILARKACFEFLKCQRLGEWPGYADDVIGVDLPQWGERRLQAAHDMGMFQVAAEMQRPLEAA